MKKCPNCQKTFDDNMKFCQSDGTPLVVVADNKPEVDPYATMVANKADLEIPPEEPKEESKVEVDPYATMVAPSQPVKKDVQEEDDGDILDLLSDDTKEEDIDPMKTMVVSGNTADNIKVNIPEEKAEDKSVPTPSAETPKTPIADDASEAQTILSPDIPKFDEPKIDPPNLSDTTPKIKDKPPAKEVNKETPSSPFSAEKPKSEKASDSKPAPIPSPFDDSMPPGYAPPSTPPFEPPKEPLKPEPLNVPKKEEKPKSPFTEPNKPVEEPKKTDWSNAPSTSSKPVSNAGNQAIANNNQFESPITSDSPTADGQNQTLAYVSLGFGIASYICGLGALGGIIAIITGYMARKNIAENPSEYGGGTFAMIGMVLGVISIILTVLAIVLWVVLVVMANQ